MVVSPLVLSCLVLLHNSLRANQGMGIGIDGLNFSRCYAFFKSFKDYLRVI